MARFHCVLGDHAYGSGHYSNETLTTSSQLTQARFEAPDEVAVQVITPFRSGDHVYGGSGHTHLSPAYRPAARSAVPFFVTEMTHYGLK